MIQSNQIQKTITFYEEEAVRYDQTRWNNPIGAYVDHVQKTIVNKEMHLSLENQKILDLGMGTGRFAAEIAVKGGFVLGLDSALPMLKIARAKITSTSYNRRVRYLKGNALSFLPFKDNTLDGCICINVFSHFTPNQCLNTIKEVYRVLKPGGFFIANFLNLFSLYFIFGIFVNQRKQAIASNVYSHWYPFWTIRRIFNSVDFDIETIKGNVYFPKELQSSFLLSPLKFIDTASRSSPLKYVAPVLFVRGCKAKINTQLET